MSARPRSEAIATRVLAWFDHSGRHDLPWQQTRSRYRVWISEVMLQQTQVATVIGYFERFTQRFPDVVALADAQLDDVLGLWSGLGYYARARNLHKAAQTVRDEYGGTMPDTLDGLLALPGIGRSTAGAILALSDDQRHPILDGNVKRVLARHDAVAGWPGTTAVARRLWALAEHYTPQQRVADYTQAMMDLGATVCRRAAPACGCCPLATSCAALAADAVHAYPGRRARKPNPERHTRMLVLRDAAGALLLERRPEQGIWGGLWCFPQTGTDSVVADSLAGIATQAVAEAARLPAFTHKFTHFDLHIEPLLFDVDDMPAVADDGLRRWYRPHEIAALGVPRPVGRIVESLQSTFSLFKES